MAGTQPGERRPDPPAAGGRRLAEPPSARYVPRPHREAGGAPGAGGESALRGPLVRSIAAAALGAAVLFLIGGLLAQPAALVIAAGAVGGAIGLLLARAAIPDGNASPVDRRRLTWIAVGLALGAIVAAAVATWQFALTEGGALGLVDYLSETFGLIIPAEAVVAAVTAAWGATAGPVQR